MPGFTAVLEALAHRRLGLELAVALALTVTLSVAAVLLLRRLVRASTARLIVARLPLLFPAPLLLLWLLLSI